MLRQGFCWDRRGRSLVSQMPPDVWAFPDHGDDDGPGRGRTLYRAEGPQQ
jgi:hypothetical protein